MSFPGQEFFFSNGTSYKISSVVDGSVIDLEGSKTKDGAKLLNWDWSGSGNQRWTAYAEGSGFRLEPNLPMMKGKFVVDYNHGKGLVALYGFHGSDNQQWNVEQVPNGNGAVVIYNLSNGYCLRSQGHGKQLKASPKAFEDKSIWWYLTAT